MATVTADEMRRLAFIKYLYGVAVEQSRQPQPMKAASVLAFHDAVELFLELATEHLGVWKRDMKFQQYFEQLESVVSGGSVPWKAQMSRLNTARVGLKHHSNLPDELTIEEFRSSVTGFFSDATKLVFGMEFSDVSMLGLLQCVPAQMSLQEAEVCMKDSRTKDAMEKIALAFAQLIDDYEYRKVEQYGRSPFLPGRRLGVIDKLSGPNTDVVQALQESVKLLSLGFDYRRFARFHLLTPKVARFAGGGYGINPQRAEEPTTDECRFCFDFVIESALHLQEFDF